MRVGGRMRLTILKASLASSWLLAAIAAYPAAGFAADCQNEPIRSAQVSLELPSGTVDLPACMALEMVSPPIKFGQEVPELSAFSTNGQRALFRAKAALAETPGLQALTGDAYIGERVGDGWRVASTSPPASARIVEGGALKGGPYAFNADLGGWLLFGATQSQAMAGEFQVFGGGPGVFGPLSPLLRPIDDSGTGDIQFFVAVIDAGGTSASADLSATVFSPARATTAFLAGDPRESTVGLEVGRNSYVAFRGSDGHPKVELLTRDGHGNVYGGRCGSRAGGWGRNQGAISPDGSRIYFTTRPGQADTQACNPSNPLRIMVRTRTATTGPEIGELLGGAGPTAGDDVFQGASIDGSRVYFVSPRSLATSDLDTAPQTCSTSLGSSAGCDLYLFDSTKQPSERLIQVSRGDDSAPSPGAGADVLAGTAAISSDGARVYFVAQGVLTTSPNPEGDVAGAGQPNLYVFNAEAEELAFVGRLASGDAGEVWGVAQSFMGAATAVPMRGFDPNRGGDGHVLVFASQAPLTDDDVDGGVRDLFRYDAEAETLARLSKAAPGGSELPPSGVQVNPNGVPPSSNFAEQGRWVSEDGSTVAFATAEPLDPADSDGLPNPYLWKDGRLARLPAVVAQTPQRPVVSADGETVGFTTTAPLLPSDGDTARDAYVVRVGGGFPELGPAAPCDPLLEGACRTAVPEPPAPGPPGSALLIDPGNPRVEPGCRKGFVRRAGRCVRKPCKRGEVRRAGRCVKKAGGKKGSRKGRSGVRNGAKGGLR